MRREVSYASHNKRRPGESLIEYSVRTGKAVEVKDDEDMKPEEREALNALKVALGHKTPDRSGLPKEEISPKPDLEYAKLTKEQINEKHTRLQAIYDKYFPSGSSHAGNVEFRGGYHFFPQFNPRIVDGRNFRDVYKELANPAYFQFPEHFREKAARAKEVLGQEYKVHLMPKLEYTPFILDQLFQAIQNDPELADAISQIKVIHDDKKTRDEVMPGIVIYTGLGKEKAQKALNEVYEHLSKFAGLGTDSTPRFNQKVNSLIYYAQSGGDIKNDYVNGAKLRGKDIARDGIFDPDLIHFVGDHKLAIPH